MPHRYSPHDESTAEQWKALWIRLDAKGFGLPATWKYGHTAGAVSALHAEAERQAVMVGIMDDLRTLFLAHPEAKTVVEVCALAGVDAAGVEQRIAAIPTPDDARLRWLIAEHTRAEHEGTLLPRVVGVR